MYIQILNETDRYKGVLSRMKRDTEMDKSDPDFTTTHNTPTHDEKFNHEGELK